MLSSRKREQEGTWLEAEMLFIKGEWGVKGKGGLIEIETLLSQGFTEALGRQCQGHRTSSLPNTGDMQ